MGARWSAPGGAGQAAVALAARPRVAAAARASASSARGSARGREAREHSDGDGGGGGGSYSGGDADGFTHRRGGFGGRGWGRAPYEGGGRRGDGPRSSAREPPPPRARANELGFHGSLHKDPSMEAAIAQAAAATGGGEVRSLANAFANAVFCLGCG